MAGSGNPNHDPKTGEFSAGGGGGESQGKHLGADSGARASNLKAHIQAEHATAGRAALNAVNDLKQAATDNAAFDAVVARIEQDKSINKAGMRAIAQDFLGHDIKASKGRSDAIKEIRDRQMLNQRQEARGREIDKHNKSW